MEVFGIKLQIFNQEIWSPAYSQLQFAILKLLASHCNKNNNFISSSSLFIVKSSKSTPINMWSMESSQSESPASQHFKMILEFVHKMLIVKMSDDQLAVILDWCLHLIQQTNNHAEQLKNHLIFNLIVQKINEISIKASEELILKCASCLDSLLVFEILHQDIFSSIAEVCCVQMCSVSQKIRSRYSTIFAKLPLRYSLEQVTQLSGLNQKVAKEVSDLEHWHLSSKAEKGILKAEFFKEFFEKITFSKDPDTIEDFVLDVFKNCWEVEGEKADEYKDMTMRDVRTLFSWIQWEAAQFCVDNKLKTPLGKPQVIKKFYLTLFKLSFIIYELSCFLGHIYKNRSYCERKCSHSLSQRQAHCQKLQICYR